MKQRPSGMYLKETKTTRLTKLKISLRLPKKMQELTEKPSMEIVTNFTQVIRQNAKSYKMCLQLKYKTFQPDRVIIDSIRPPSKPTEYVNNN